MPGEQKSKNKLQKWPTLLYNIPIECIRLCGLLNAWIYRPAVAAHNLCSAGFSHGSCYLPYQRSHALPHDHGWNTGSKGMARAWFTAGLRRRSRSRSESTVLAGVGVRVGNFFSAGVGVGVGVDKILPTPTPALQSKNRLSSCEIVV